VVDWEMAQRRVALGERATLTGAGDKMSGKISTTIFRAKIWLTTPVRALTPTH
jgi:hypothetical protein